MRTLISSTITQKILVALTGIFFILFLIGHLLGNLQIFFGPKALNDYAETLHSFPKILWIARIALIISLFIHVYLTIKLTQKNKEARKDNYILKKSKKASFSSQYMLVSGLTILAFVLYHLAHFTLGFIDPDLMKLIDEQGNFHVYNMVVLGFSHPLVSGFYILAQILLGMHVSHGFSSSLRTLGLSDKNLFNCIKNIGNIFAFIIAILYISIPLSVLFGILTPDF